MDILKAVGTGSLVGLLLRASLDAAASGTGFTVLAALAAGQDVRVATLIRLWLVGGVLATLASGALAAVLVRRHHALWVLVSMGCAALPLLVP